MVNKKEFDGFVEKLEKHGISFYLDTDIGHTGERLENYVFEKDDNILKVVEKIINRKSGQSHMFVPTGSKKKGEDFKIIPLTDKEFYEQQLMLILKRF